MPMRRSLTFKASEMVYVAASLILKRYAADLDDPCTQKLEAILAGFSHQVCLQESLDMKPTSITSYFTL